MGSGRRVVGVLAGMAIGCCASTAHAVCIYNGELYAKTTLSQEFRDSALVIEGRVQSVRYTPGNDNEDRDPVDQDVITPIRIFKGIASAKITFYTWHNSGGFYLDKGGKYLLFLDAVPVGEYGKKRPAGFDINYQCGQSKSWAKVSPAAIAELKALSAGKQ